MCLLCGFQTKTLSLGYRRIIPGLVSVVKKPWLVVSKSAKDRVLFPFVKYSFYHRIHGTVYIYLYMYATNLFAQLVARFFHAFRAYQGIFSKIKKEIILLPQPATIVDIPTAFLLFTAKNTVSTGFFSAKNWGATRVKRPKMSCT